MALFKCKVCGKSIEIVENQCTATCKCCGTEQTVPRTFNEQKIKLYNKANHYRINKDFNRAMSIYKDILKEDVTDSEAYWGIFLCKYGIKYIKNTKTNKIIPQINILRTTPMSNDNNFKSALHYASGYQSVIYDDEANKIDKMQEKLLSISKKEEPYDVFICCKETSKDDEKTTDFLLANDIYNQLTNDGIKVFFPSISLKDKLKSNLEPYIFSALRSVKVMIVVGTTPENFKDLTVKTLWTRYLNIVKRAKSKKILIPIYRDMEVLKLPREFSNTFSLDANKNDYIQKLIEECKNYISENKVVQKRYLNDNPIIAAMFNKLSINLLNKNWYKADTICDNILQEDSKCAYAYLGKLMAEFRINNREELKFVAEPYNENKNYKNIIKYGDEDLKKELRNNIKEIKARNKLLKQNEIYKEALLKKSKAKDIKQFQEVADDFKSIKGFKDSNDLYNECIASIEKIKLNEEKRKLKEIEEKYNKALTDMKKAEELPIFKSEEEYINVAKQFENLKGYKNSRELLDECLNMAKRFRSLTYFIVVGGFVLFCLIASFMIYW